MTLSTDRTDAPPPEADWQGRFQLSPNSRLLTPDVPGLATLVQGLAAGASIHARQGGSDRITLSRDGAQRLFCESSGSSGRPKTIRRTPESWCRSFEISRSRFGLGAGDRYAGFGHLGHSLTLYGALEALHLGSDLALLEGRAPRAQAQALRDMAITVLYATPTQLRLLLKGAQAAEVTELGAVRAVFSGGGKMEDALRQALRALMPNAAIREFYGASETSFVTISDVSTPEGSVGRAYPGVTLDIRPTGSALPPGCGEIWVAGPYLFEGYEAGATPDTRRDGPFLSLGEIGRCDSDGHLFLMGRKSRMVTVADQNVFLDEVERVLAEADGIPPCAALAIGDPLRGHRIVAVVEGARDPMLEARLMRHCRASLPAHAVPKQVIFVDALPLLPAGKPDLLALQAMIGGAA